MDDVGRTPDPKINRRRAIQAAAALGVGAAAWTGPRVGLLGATPAYAGTCSAGELGSAVLTPTALASDNTVCGNASPAGNNNNYRLFAASPNPANVILSSGTLGVSIVGTCTTGPGGATPIGATIPTTSGGAQVRCAISLWEGATNLLAIAVGDSGQTVFLPEVTRGDVNGDPSAPNLRLVVLCSDDPLDCL